MDALLWNVKVFVFKMGATKIRKDFEMKYGPFKGVWLPGCEDVPSYFTDPRQLHLPERKNGIVQPRKRNSLRRSKSECILS